MKLKDIDWRNETLYLRRAKNCRPQVLPLLPIVGDAIIRYIKEARFNKKRKTNALFYADALMNSFPLRLYTSWSGQLVKDWSCVIAGPSLRHACATLISRHSAKKSTDFGHIGLDTTYVPKSTLRTYVKVADMDWEELAMKLNEMTGLYIS